jgi:hypothetical protein
MTRPPGVPYETLPAPTHAYSFISLGAPRKQEQRSRCIDDFASHFCELPDGSWQGLTPSARYTIDALRLNRRHLLEIRILLRTIVPE